MTLRQKLLQWLYPLFMKWRRKSAIIITNHKNLPSLHSIYHLNFLTTEKKQIDLENFRGKKIMLVNTASDCGYTPQYKELQELQDRFAGSLVVIGFPSNDFKEQEKLNDEEIAGFCKRNFGVQFPLAQKSQVGKGEEQHPVFTWLSSVTENGWNDKAPRWNFSKYLVDENGRLTHYFDPSISPLSTEVVEAIQSK